MRECEHKQSMCHCIDWEKDDLADKIHHVISNFEFTGFELNYTTLEPEKGRLLCVVYIILYYRRQRISTDCPSIITRSTREEINMRWLSVSPVSNPAL